MRSGYKDVSTTKSVELMDATTGMTKETVMLWWRLWIQCAGAAHCWKWTISVKYYINRQQHSLWPTLATHKHKHSHLAMVKRTLSVYDCERQDRSYDGESTAGGYVEGRLLAMMVKGWLVAMLKDGWWLCCGYEHANHILCQWASSQEFSNAQWWRYCQIGLVV